MSSYFDSPETLAALAKYDEDLRLARLHHQDLVRRRDNPVHPENLEASCGQGHRVRLNIGSWKGRTIKCENCGRVLADWQDPFKGKRRKDSPFVDEKAGYILMSIGEANCRRDNADDNG